MLKSLNVKNFAIIEDLSVDFKEGMTVLTGETGAGKSLIIDTILLLLGARADSDMIRYGTTYASIEGEFTYNNDSIVKGNKQGDGYYVWSSNLFKSFKNIDSTTVQGKKISENTYTITDNTTKNEIYQLAGFGIYDLMFVSKGITLTITDETKLECVIKIDLGTSGSVTITSKDVGNTTIQGL